MLRKLGKCFLGLTIIGGIVAAIAYFMTVSQSDDEFDDMGMSAAPSGADEDLNLDEDLEPISKRDYVPLNLNNTKENSTKEND